MPVAGVTSSVAAPPIASAPYPSQVLPLVQPPVGIGPGHVVLGTVPPQHMYGFESTVLLPLASGAILTAERPYYPADIDSLIRRMPAPRTLFITPFHLRVWLESGECEPI